LKLTHHRVVNLTDSDLLQQRRVIVDVSFRYPPWESRPKRMLLAQSMDERSCGYIWGIFWGTLVLALGVIFLRFRV